MNILAIETSCDETGIAILSLQDDKKIKVLGNALASQIDLHAQYGGVFPAMAKRAHAEKIIPLTIDALTQSSFLNLSNSNLGEENREKISSLCHKEQEMIEPLIEFFNNYQKPEIDYIAVTVGPGLEPALWVGVNTAKVLGAIWNIPIIPINHMEGHIVTAVIKEEEKDLYSLEKLNLPSLSLLVSGGHTELVLFDGLEYQKIGLTRDDAVGEAFDKVARMLGLSYPGGPAISKLAALYRLKSLENPIILPRPMMYSSDYDFSFSGIKTAVLYTIRDMTDGNTRELNSEEKESIACAFEDAVVEVLLHKTFKAIDEYGVQSLILGGGVASNTFLRESVSKKAENFDRKIDLYFPKPILATDNALMIGVSAIWQVLQDKIKTSAPENLVADGNLSL